MKTLLTLSLFALPLVSFADFTQEIRANPITCVGDAGEPVSLEIQYNGRTGEHNLTLSIGEARPANLKTSSKLTIENEGNNSISQRDSKLNYSLYLGGEGVDQAADDLMSNKLAKEYKAKGQLNILHLQGIEVTCTVSIRK